VVGTSSGPPQPPRLADMFAAPANLVHRIGGFQGARASAKDSRRWLLVNIQKDSEFASHALNRDVWRDELVENLIREGFIFWQAVRADSTSSVYLAATSFVTFGLRYSLQLAFAVVDVGDGVRDYPKENN